MAYRTQLVWPRWPPAVKALVIANAAVFLLTAFTQMDVHRFLGMVPAAVHDGRRLQIWGLATYMFMHSGFTHLLFNMLGLWMFGSDVEIRWGTPRFLRFYLMCGVGAGLAWLLGSWNSEVPLVGASGAVYGVLAAYAMLWPRRRLLLWGIAPIEARWVAVGYAAISFFSMAGERHAGVAHFAHLAGLAAGAAYVYWTEYRGGGFPKWPRRRKLRAVRDEPPLWGGRNNDRTWH